MRIRIEVTHLLSNKYSPIPHFPVLQSLQCIFDSLFIHWPGHGGGFDIMLDAKFQHPPNLPPGRSGGTLNTDTGRNDFQHPDWSLAEIDGEGINRSAR